CRRVGIHGYKAADTIFRGTHLFGKLRAGSSKIAKGGAASFGGGSMHPVESRNPEYLEPEYLETKTNHEGEY
ncbi:MAG: hypothetical protein WAO10_01255, partial [Candidatus Sulfotelmatobacter sp.]